MQNDGRTILALIAAGRISAAEAERLLRVWNEAREELWLVLACVLLCVAQSGVRVSLDGVGQLAHELVREGLGFWQAAGALLMKGMVGTV